MPPIFAVAGNPHCNASAEVRDAIEPLFNDIADRWQLGERQEYLVAPAINGALRSIRFHPPRRVQWATEGRRFYVEPPGLDTPRDCRLRTFWFVHNNGAISYHLSFEHQYEESLSSYYFLSLMQKLCAPKEMERDTARPGGGATPQRSFFDYDHDVLAFRTGVALLDEMLLGEDDRDDKRPFWRFVADCFNADAGALRAVLPGFLQPDATAFETFRFENCVRPVAFPEIAGFAMPQARFLFYLRDKSFFEALWPTGQSRSAAVAAVAETKDDDGDEGGSDGGDRHTPICLDARCEHMALDAQKDWLRYLFLAGFNQNIIDFLHQDMSEVLDSLAPIYPTEVEDGEKPYFVRYANQRSFISYVTSARSLEIGADYIGTCPYAFLIHLTCLHNEFLADDYAVKGNEIVHAIRASANRGDFSRAADRFYDFRMKEYFDYHAYRHMNVFRYETEASVFDALEKIRGVARKQAALEHLVDSMERQSQEMEAKQQQKRERNIGIGLGAVGFLGLVQVLLQFATTPATSAWGGALIIASVTVTAFVMTISSVAFLPAAGRAIMWALRRLRRR